MKGLPNFIKDGGYQPANVKSEPDEYYGAAIDVVAVMMDVNVLPIKIKIITTTIFLLEFWDKNRTR